MPKALICKSICEITLRDGVNERFAGTDGEHRAGGFGDDVVGGGERDVAGPVSAGLRAHNDEVGVAVLCRMKNFRSCGAEADAKIGHREVMIGAIERLLHALGVNLAKVVQLETGVGAAVFHDVKSSEPRGVFAGERDGIRATAFGAGAKIGDEEDGADLRELRAGTGRADGENGASGVAEDLFGVGAESRWVAGAEAVRS